MASDDGPIVRQFFRSATPRWLKQRLLPFEADLWARACQFCQEHSGALILDVGCGRAMYDSGTFGVDLHLLNLHGRKNCVCGDALELPFASGAFDYMLCNAALHHFEHPAAALQEMRRAVRPGGELLLTVPDRFPKTGQPDDYFRFSVTTITALLERTGWKLVECAPVGGIFWTFSRHSLEWLFGWNRGFQWMIFPIVAPVAGVFLPLACFYADRFVAHGDGTRTLGWAIVARNA